MIDISIDKKVVEGNIDSLIKQTPFLTSMAVNNTAFTAMRSVRSALPHQLKLTKKFITSSMVVNRSHYKQPMPTAYVGFLDRVSLQSFMESGRGTRLPRGKAILIPVNVKRNSRGGITKANKPENLLRRRDTFSGKVGGIPGIWQQKKVRGGKKQLILLYRYHNSVTYKRKHTSVEEIVTKVASRNFNKELEKAFERNIRFSRR